MSLQGEAPLERSTLRRQRCLAKGFMGGTEQRLYREEPRLLFSYDLGKYSITLRLLPPAFPMPAVASCPLCLNPGASQNFPKGSSEREMGFFQSSRDDSLRTPFVLGVDLTAGI